MHQIFQKLLKISLILALKNELSGVAAATNTFTLYGVTITYTKNDQTTNFTMSSPLGNGVSPSNAWLAVGFNLNNNMNGASVVLCTNSGSTVSVQHYYNANDFSTLLDSSNPTLGLTQTSVSVSNGVFTCSFTRDNSNSNSKYVNIAQNSVYVLVAYGTGTISNHNNNKAITSSRVSLTSTETSTASSSSTTTKTTTQTSTSTKTTTTTTTLTSRKIVTGISTETRTGTGTGTSTETSTETSTQTETQTETSLLTETKIGTGTETETSTSTTTLTSDKSFANSIIKSPHSSTYLLSLFVGLIVTFVL